MTKSQTPEDRIVRFLITGSAGFIGFHLTRHLLEIGHQVVGVDGLTPYDDVQLERRRHGILLQSSNFSANEVILDTRGRVGTETDLRRLSVGCGRPPRGASWRALQPGKSRRLTARASRNLSHGTATIIVCELLCKLQIFATPRYVLFYRSWFSRALPRIRASDRTAIRWARTLPLYLQATVVN